MTSPTVALSSSQRRIVENSTGGSPDSFPSSHATPPTGQGAALTMMPTPKDIEDGVSLPIAERQGSLHFGEGEKRL